MFTGLIEEIGVIKSVIKNARSARINISASSILQDVKSGDSISTNGVCLTVTEYNSNSFWLDVMPETMRMSNLKFLKPGSRVNLERALHLGDRIGGHILSGHIDGIGSITDLKKEDNATWVTIEAEKEILKYIVKKGSVAIDGTSLTAAYADENIVKVSIIPLTAHKTTILEKRANDIVNIECDMLGKYVEKLLQAKSKEEPKSSIDTKFLSDNGYI